MRRVSGPRMCKILEGRGWVFQSRNPSHVTYKHPENPLLITVVHGQNDLSTGTQRRIMRIADLTDDDLA